MSRRIDFEKPLSADDVEYLKGHNDPRWETAEVEKPRGRKPKPAPAETDPVDAGESDGEKEPEA